MYPFQIHSIALSTFASLIGPFGGFFASGFKRAFKIKVGGACSLFLSLSPSQALLPCRLPSSRHLTPSAATPPHQPPPASEQQAVHGCYFHSGTEFR